MYTFNDKFDRYLLKPVAKGYRAITPKPVSKSSSNFFRNLNDPGIMLNNSPQRNPGQAASDLGRVSRELHRRDRGSVRCGNQRGLQNITKTSARRWRCGAWVTALPGAAVLRAEQYARWPVTDRGLGEQLYPPNHMEEHSTERQAVCGGGHRQARAVARRLRYSGAGRGAGSVYIRARSLSRQSRRNQIYDGNPPQAAPPPGLFEDDTPAPRPGNGATQSR